MKKALPLTRMIAVAKNLMQPIVRAMDLALRRGPLNRFKTRKRTEQTSTFLEQHLII